MSETEDFFLPSSDELNHLVNEYSLSDLLPLTEEHLELINQLKPEASPSTVQGMMQNWPGPYQFTVFIHQREEEVQKKARWIYCKELNKLYIKKDACCVINYSTNVPMAHNVKIRATAYFSSPAHLNEIVHRCINHSMLENVDYKEHLVRTNCSPASYETNDRSKVLSVVVDYENPPVGQDFSYVIYRFACLSSCAGGPNRRPMMLVLTLEQGNEILGRQKIDLKVCSNPFRDMKQETSKSQKPKMGSVLFREGKQENSAIEKPSIKHKLADNEPNPQPKKKPRKDLTIKVKDAGCYDFLKKMETFYYMHKIVKKFPYLNYIKAGFSSSDSENN